MSVILFLLVLFVLILVHEWGHFIVAKKTGMRVDEFAIGFPPRLFKLKRGETEYTFNLLPIGGFVRIFGEAPGSEVDVLDQPRAFSARPKWAQALVLVAGVTMNVIFAWFLFLVTFMVGVPTAVEEQTASKEAVLYISSILPDSPLLNSILPGSSIEKVSAPAAELINPTPSTFIAFVETHANETLTINYSYGDEAGELAVLPVAGLIPDDPERRAIGVSLALAENVKQPFGEAVVSATTATVSGLESIAVGLYSLIRDSIQGTADFSQVAGPIGIVGLVGDAAEFGLTSLLTFTAIISLNLAVINMLPVPALDGGRLLFVGIEAVTRRPINPIWTNRLNLLGFALLMVFMVVVTWNDIARLFN